jgi:hypothetical protein
MPRSMCSLMPKPKLPLSLKFLRISSYSLTLRPASCGFGVGGRLNAVGR